MAFSNTLSITKIVTIIFHISTLNCFATLATVHFSIFNSCVTQLVFAANQIVYHRFERKKIYLRQKKNDNATVKFCFVILVLSLWFLSFYAAMLKYVLIFYGTIQFRGQFSRDIEILQFLMQIYLLNIGEILKWSVKKLIHKHMEYLCIHLYILITQKMETFRRGYSFLNSYQNCLSSIRKIKILYFQT